MRKPVAILSMLFALSATGTELWRWKDADGVVHYSDRPVQGAERIVVNATQRGTGAIEPNDPNARTEASRADTAPKVVGYARCEVAAPTNDQVFNSVSSVSARVEVEPALQSGHQLQVFLNGRAYPDWPSTQFAFTLPNLYRGSYTLGVRVLDANGRPVCSGSVINFHVRQPSLLAPGRRPAGG